MTTVKSVVTAILTRLAAIDVSAKPSEGFLTEDGDESREPKLSTLSPEAQRLARPLLVALHFLFPHEFLPALDILDRRLIRCLRVQDSESMVDAMLLDRKQPTFNGAEVLYVQSASSQHEHGHYIRGATASTNTLTKQFYEVRLDSWNCSCAAFAQSSLQAHLSEEGGNKRTNENIAQIGNELGAQLSLAPGLVDDWDSTFGGHKMCSSHDMAVPICKHILAAAVGKAVPSMFGGGIDARTVNVDGVAGMAAGWGDS